MQDFEDSDNYDEIGGGSPAQLQQQYNNHPFIEQNNQNPLLAGFNEN
jgi:hypothetical protein